MLALLLPASCLQASSVVRLTDGWVVCPGTVSLEAASRPTFSHTLTHHACYSAVTPTTVLASMLLNGSFFPNVTDPFFDDNLARIPDISTVGKPYYTRVFRREITAQDVSVLLSKWLPAAAASRLSSAAAEYRSISCCVQVDRHASSDSSGGRLLLHLRGVNYFASVFVDGKAVSPIQSRINNTARGKTAGRLAGMYHRWSFDLGDLGLGRSLVDRRNDRSPLFTVAVLVEPPEFCGRGGPARCKGVKGSCGQVIERNFQIDAPALVLN